MTEPIKEITKEQEYYEEILKVIAEWPEWKIDSLCLDESDIMLREKINHFKLSHVHLV